MKNKKKKEIKYIITEQFSDEWNKLTEEEKKQKFNEKYFKYIMMMERRNYRTILDENKN